MTSEELRALFPEITDEEIANRQAAQVESKRQSLRDQISNQEAVLEALKADLEALEPKEKEATETPEEEQAEAPENNG